MWLHRVPACLKTFPSGNMLRARVTVTLFSVLNHCLRPLATECTEQGAFPRRVALMDGVTRADNKLEVFKEKRVFRDSVLISLEVKRQDHENKCLSGACNNVCPGIGSDSYCFCFCLDYM